MRSLKQHIADKRNTIRTLGFWNASEFLLKRVLYGFLNRIGVVKSGTPYKVNARQLHYPVYCRVGTSDGFVFAQIFMEEEFACIPERQDCRLILDLGANVGYASAYLLSRFPNATIISVEPESSNFDILVKNLAPYGNRAKAVRAGIWSHDAGLMIESVNLPGQNEWGFFVREAKSGEIPDVHGLGIDTLLSQHLTEPIDVLKIDIEGTEKTLFKENYVSWLSRVRNLTIELHGGDCTAIFDRAMANYPHRRSISGELVVCEMTPKGA